MFLKARTILLPYNFNTEWATVFYMMTVTGLTFLVFVINPVSENSKEKACESLSEKMKR